jgi:hypothetical protein
MVERLASRPGEEVELWLWSQLRRGRDRLSEKKRRRLSKGVGLGTRASEDDAIAGELCRSPIHCAGT